MAANILPKRMPLIKIHPPLFIMLGFAIMITVGTILLCLPAASADGASVGFLNALFTATSSTCVTGLVVLETFASWSIFGKVVIMLLIQFGGLGFMTILTLFMLLIKRNINLRNRLAIQATFNQNSIGGMVRLVRNVAKITFTFEAVGALVLMLAFHFSAGMNWGEALYQGVFHAISAFCNAGFDNIGSTSLMPFLSHSAIIIPIMTLFICGGLGFTVWSEFIDKAKNEEKRSLRSRIRHLSLHTKIAVVVTATLLVSGMLIFLLLEWQNPATLASLSFGEKLEAALFQSATVRTAGFHAIPQVELTDTSKFVSSLLMLIGGSPAGTAGGIKTVTIGIIFFSMLSVIKGRNRIEVFGRNVPMELLQKALMVTSTMLLLAFVATIALHFTESNSIYQHDFIDLLFESCSAVGTVGISTGLTPYLSPAGQVIIIICMYLGRLSPVTVAVALTLRLHANNDGTNLPEERVIIG